MNEEAWNLFKNFYNSLLGEYNPDKTIMKSLKIISTIIENMLGVTSKRKTIQFESENSKKIKACHSNLSKIITLLKETDEKRNKFMKNFFAWKIYRTEGINQLGKIAAALHKEKKLINAGKIAGAAVGIAGGAAVIGSIFFPPAAIATVPWLGALGGSAAASFLPSFLVTYTPAVSALALGGGAATAASSALTLGLTAAEILLLKKHMEEAAKVIKEDAECFCLMEEWFIHTQKFIDIMQNFFGFNLFQDIFNDLLEFLRILEKSPLLKTYDKLTARLNGLLWKMGRSFPQELKIAVIGVLLVFFLVHRQNQILLGFIISVEGLISLTSVLDASFMGASATATLIKEGVMVSSSEAPELLVRNITVGAFAGVGIALNAANIVLTSFDVYKGSISKYGKKIEEIQSKLKEELELFEQVNKELISKTRKLRIDYPLAQSEYLLDYATGVSREPSNTGQLYVYH